MTMKAFRVVLVIVCLLVPSLTFAQDLERPKNEAYQGSTSDLAPQPLDPGPLGGAESNVVPGQRLPGFRAASSLGHQVQDSDLRGHWAALLFDEDSSHLGSMGVAEDSLRAMGVALYGFSRAGEGTLRSFAAASHHGMVLLDDPTGEISRLFGMFDDDAEVIRPGLMIVDGNGVVRMVLQGPSLHSDEVLQMIRHTIRRT